MTTPPTLVDLARMVLESERAARIAHEVGSPRARRAARERREKMVHVARSVFVPTQISMIERNTQQEMFK
jgi:hypothetical protein